MRVFPPFLHKHCDVAPAIVARTETQDSLIPRCRHPLTSVTGVYCGTCPPTPLGTAPGVIEAEKKRPGDAVCSMSDVSTFGTRHVPRPTVADIVMPILLVACTTQQDSLHIGNRGTPIGTQGSKTNVECSTGYQEQRELRPQRRP